MTHGKKTITIAAAATGMLVAAGAGVASGTPHAGAAHIATPHLSVTITTTGSGNNASQTMTLSGPHKVSAGRVAISLHAVGGEAEVGVAKVKKGHTFNEAAGLFAAFGQSQGPNGPTPAGLAALNKLVEIVTFFGGLDSGSGSRVHGTVVLPKAGTYVILNDSNGPSDPHQLKVTAKAGHRTAPTSTATVKTTNAKRFAGSRVLPSKGTITFDNTATNSPHFLVLEHVRKGATRKQVIKDFSTNGRPKVLLRQSAGTDVLSPGHSQTISYDLPKGDYAEACFFPDLQTGMPHAFMGMVRIVHLK